MGYFKRRALWRHAHLMCQCYRAWLHGAVPRKDEQWVYPLAIRLWARRINTEMRLKGAWRER